MAIYICRRKGSGKPRLQQKEIYATSSKQTITPDEDYDALSSVVVESVAVHNMEPANIRSGVTVKVGDIGNYGRIASATGTFTDPSTVSTGYTAADRPQILSGYSAWVNGAEVKGNYTLAGATGVDQGKNPIDASHVMSGYQGWVNGQKISGSYTPSSMLYDGEGRATPSAKTFSPEDGMEGFLTFRVLPQNHSDIYDTTTGLRPDTLNDMGANHNFRYVDTTGMGGSPTSETLMENSDGSMSASSIQLSKSLNVYDYIKITYDYSSSSSKYIIVNATEFLNGGYYPISGYNGSYFFIRFINRDASDYSKINVTNCFRFQLTGGSQATYVTNEMCIIRKIEGITL